jgi:hypothetical protein
MRNLINTRQSATTETFVYDDGTESTIPRIAYVDSSTVHTEDCPDVPKLLKGNPQEMEMTEVLATLEGNNPDGLTECKACGDLRAKANYPAAPEGGDTDQKETTMPTKTELVKIELPDTLKPNPTILAVVKALEEGAIGTTAEISAAAGVSAPSTKSTLLTLESCGIVTHITGKDKVMTWALKGTAPAKKRTAADYAATMEEKKQANVAKKATAPKAEAKPPAKAAEAGESASKRQPTGERAKNAQEWMAARPNTPFAVRQIEDGCSYTGKTLAGILDSLDKNPDSPIVRAEAEFNGRKYKGFMWREEKAPAKKAAAKKAPPAK